MLLHEAIIQQLMTKETLRSIGEKMVLSINVQANWKIKMKLNPYLTELTKK